MKTFSYCNVVFETVSINSVKNITVNSKPFLQEFEIIFNALTIQTNSTFLTKAFDGSSKGRSTIVAQQAARRRNIQ
jgi:hypothetical protein